MKILVLGASGYLGGRISRFFLRQGNDVVLHARNVSGLNKIFVDSPATYIEGDIANAATIDQIVAAKADIIINTISLNHHQTGVSLRQTTDTNVNPTLALLERLAKSQQTNTKYIYISTQQVYGKIKEPHITEETPCQPANLYGLTHLLSENIGDFYHLNTPLTCINLRLSNVYGAPLFVKNDCWWLVINDFCKSAFTTGHIKITSDGTPQRNFIYADDLCQAINVLSQIAKNDFRHNCFNIGGPATFTILELAELVAAVFVEKYGNPVAILDKDGIDFNRQGAPRGQTKFDFDIARLVSLGFVCKFDMTHGIKEIFDFLEKSPSSV